MGLELIKLAMCWIRDRPVTIPPSGLGTDETATYQSIQNRSPSHPVGLELEDRIIEVYRLSDVSIPPSGLRTKNNHAAKGL